MQYYISNKMRNMKPSAVREIFKYAADPQVISLSAGSPSVEALPVKAIGQIMNEIRDQDLHSALLYSVSEGHPPLREELKKYLQEQHNSFSEHDDLLIVSGAQQCMDLTVKVLCDEGDTVLCEDPSFVGNLNCIRSYGVNLVGVPMEEDGIDLEQLEKTLQKQPKVRFLYLIPNFQNPTGKTMSLEKRKGCYQLAKKYGVLIFEDDPYGDLRFAGEALPSIKSMDTEGLVIYARTFSKILSAGIRVGYMALPKDVFNKFVVAKQCVDVHTGMLSQLLCYRFLTQYNLQEHIQAIGKIYRRKCQVMLDALDKIPSDKLRYTRPQGGLFVWCTLPDASDSSEFCLKLIREHKVAVVPGSAFLAQEGGCSPSFRMTFGAPTDQQIVQAVEIIGNAL
jgi:2-aminoadipate transaminase